MIRAFLSVVAAVALAAGAAPAQSYPARPIRIVVPFSPGGPTDMISRIIGQRMQSILGQTIFVENRLGAGGTIGTRAVVAADPDGYTPLVGNTAAPVIAPVINKNLGNGPAIAFVPIAQIATSSNVLVVNPTLPVTTVADLIAYARANPGKLSYSSPGTGTPAHLIAERFKAGAGLDLVHAPYKGGGVSVQDVVSGQVQLTFENPATALPLIEAGSVRALAVTSETRSPHLPEVPTMVESGIADFVTVSVWRRRRLPGPRACRASRAGAGAHGGGREPPGRRHSGRSRGYIARSRRWQYPSVQFQRPGGRAPAGGEREGDSQAGWSFEAHRERTACVHRDDDRSRGGAAGGWRAVCKVGRR
jgi:tripartite-type tricarboxylate transporter receptor subunit TctC